MPTIKGNVNICHNISAVSSLSLLIHCIPVHKSNMNPDDTPLLVRNIPRSLTPSVSPPSRFSRTISERSRVSRSPSRRSTRVRPSRSRSPKCKTTKTCRRNKSKRQSFTRQRKRDCNRRQTHAKLKDVSDSLHSKCIKHKQISSPSRHHRYSYPSSPDANYRTNRRSHCSRHSEPAAEKAFLGKLVNVLNDRNNSGNSGTGPHAAHSIIPDFDPQAKSQTMKDWLAKINESAHVYGWSDKQVIFYALPKLRGLAKHWYDGLTSVKFTWMEWQDKLISAFPCEENYGDLLSDMLARKTRRNETLEEYYYDKIMLINRCELKGKQAVDCLTHGIFDHNVKMNVQGANMLEPECVLKYFRNISSNVIDVPKKTFIPYRDQGEQIKKVTDPSNRKGVSVTCFNCGEPGHIVTKCPKEVLKCQKCRLFGHVDKDCK